MAAFDTPPHRRVMRELETIEAVTSAGGNLSNVVVQDVDLTRVAVEWTKVDVGRSMFLGCVLPEGITDLLTSKGASVFPRFAERPYDPYRARLYTATELREQITWNTTRQSRDHAIYEWFKSAGTSTPDAGEALAQRTHDFSIDDALSEFIGDSREERLARRIVGMMGGHGAPRSADPTSSFGKAARVAQLLGKDHLVATGGGPGVMEGANLGASLADQPVDALTTALTILATAPTDEHPDYHKRAEEVAASYPDSHENLSVPTWFYGFEPSNPFATHIAKYFANSIREEGLLALCLAGVIYLDGAAGTVQEIFMDAAQNYYQTFGYISPMVFVGRARWDALVGLLRSEADADGVDPRYRDYIFITDSAEEAASIICDHPPLLKHDPH